MIGTDQKPYPWLVKGGEDLRQDQRIEQLWHLMNDLLRANTSTSARGLLLETYKVVPMSLQLGLVEWVEGTTPLKGIIEDQLKSDGGPRQIGEMPANRLHTQWLDKFVPKDPKRVNDAHGNYHEMIVSATRANALAKWDKQMQETDQTLLRRGIASIARSPESYLCLRNGFARSLACVSVCGYVAGIGDRHLDNFLVHNSTGFIIAIDFGHAFGSATFSLPIPELVPFRLSPQLVTFLEPIGPQGLLAHNMTHVLSSLVQNKEQLLNLMEVFIKEPHMDWIKHAEKNVTSSHTGQSNQNNSSGGGGGGAGGSSAGGGGGGSMSGVVVGTFAERRLKMVRDKLELRNPAFVTCDELDESAQRATRGPMIEKMKEYTKGYREFNFRARVGDRCATVAEQVEALIDMASDANILARSWQGWSSFC
jgi:DNA-dependent protein kinase catalytic subunit